MNLTVGASRTFHHIRLNKQAKADLLLLARFLGEFNGSSFFIKDELYNNTCTTDAASTLGYGLVFGAYWAYGAWESGVQLSYYNTGIISNCIGNVSFSG